MTHYSCDRCRVAVPTGASLRRLRISVEILTESLTPAGVDHQTVRDVCDVCLQEVEWLLDASLDYLEPPTTPTTPKETDQ